MLRNQNLDWADDILTRRVTSGASFAVRKLSFKTDDALAPGGESGSGVSVPEALVMIEDGDDVDCTWRVTSRLAMLRRADYLQ